MTRQRAADATLLVLFDENGLRWNEIRRALPEGGRSVVVEFESPGLRAASWAICLVQTRLVLVRVGTKGAAWERLDPNQRAQLWLPGDLDVEAGTMVQVEVGEP